MSLAKNLLAAVLALSSATFASDAPAPWEPEQFPISYWCGPPAKFNTLERYQEIKDANFTYAFPIFPSGTVEETKRQLDYCQQVGLKAFIYDRRMSTNFSESLKKGLDGIIADYGSHPALAGYFITDEPWGGAFPSLGKITEYLREKDPKHPGYINLLPTYVRGVNAAALGYPTYEEHVRKYVEICKPFAISYDHYHFTNGGDGPEFFENLDTVRKVSLETNTPFWNIVLLTQHGGYRNLTAPELLWEAMQTLAYGGKGLVWFTYWSPKGFDSSTNWSHAMINEDGTHDPHYDMVKSVNATVLQLGAALLKAKSTCVYQLGTVPPHGTPAPADAPVTTSDKVDLTVGLFKSPDGHTLAMIANRDYKNVAKYTLRLPDAKIEIFDPAGGGWRAYANREFHLPAAAAYLLRW